MKILVTGGNGFVGRNLVKALLIEHYDYWAPTHEQLDLCDLWDVEHAVHGWEPTHIIHLAGMVGGIQANKDFPGQFFYNNAIPSINLLHAAKDLPGVKVISLAAGCGYPKTAPIPLKEENFFDGLPQEESLAYSMAKKNLVLQGWAYKEEYGLDSTVLLPANLYGPYDNFDLESSHVVPALVRKFVEAKTKGDSEVHLWGTGNASREFIYVNDVVTAIINSLDKDLGVGPYNLGTGVETTIKHLAIYINTIVGFAGKRIWDPEKPEGSDRRYYDMSKFTEAFGYTPDTDLIDGLRETINWYKENS